MHYVSIRDKCYSVLFLFCFKLSLLTIALCASIVAGQGDPTGEHAQFEVLSTDFDQVRTVTALLTILNNILRYHTCNNYCPNVNCTI